MDEPSTSIGTGIRRTSRLVLASCVCAVLMGGIGWSLTRAPYARAQTSHLYAVESPSNPLGAADPAVSMSPVTPMDGPELVTADGAQVRSGRPLDLIIVVHEADGERVRGAKVFCEWRDSRGVRVFRASTNSFGIARISRWVAVREQGHPNLLKVSAETPMWSRARYAWFSPE